MQQQSAARSVAAERCGIESKLTWLVTTTAQPYSSASRCRLRRKRPRLIWRADSSPRPLYSTRYSAVTLSTMMSEKRESAIMEAAAMSRLPWCSVLCALAYATLSRTSCAFRPYLHHAERPPCKRQGPVHQLKHFRGEQEPGAEQQGRGWTPLCNLHEPLRPEGPLCVYVHCFAFASSHVNGQLHREEGFSKHGLEL